MMISQIEQTGSEEIAKAKAKFAGANDELPGISTACDRKRGRASTTRRRRRGTAVTSTGWRPARRILDILQIISVDDEKRSDA